MNDKCAMWTLQSDNLRGLLEVKIYRIPKLQTASINFSELSTCLTESYQARPMQGRLEG